MFFATTLALELLGGTLGTVAAAWVGLATVMIIAAAFRK